MESVKIFIKTHVVWMLSAGSGSFISWRMVGNSIMSIVTAVIITVVTFYVKEYLTELKEKRKLKGQ